MAARLTTLLIFIFAISLVAVGCGDSGDDSGSGGAASGESIETSELSKQEYLKQASAACDRERKNLVQEVNSYLEKHSSDGQPEGVLIANMARATMLPTIEAEIAAVRKLGAPEGDEEQIEEILAAQEAAVEKAKKLKNAPTLEDVESLFLKATDKYKAYGFVACTNSA